VPLRALLFDFDGLILDTETPEVLSWREVWLEHGHVFPMDRFHSGLGRVGGFDAVTALEELVEGLDRDEVTRRQDERKRDLIKLEELRPGVLDYLAEARRRGLATSVVSSSSRKWIDMHLLRLGRTEDFDLIVTADHDPARGKPSPTLYLEALDLLGLTAGEAVAFEDSPNGVRAAKAAGIFCVAIPNTITNVLNFDEADLVVTSLVELPFPVLLAEINRRTQTQSIDQQA
jgi:HAD superfamily hydrolase (TIGR01509 family)